MPVGIQGCADMFVDEDGLCRPSDEKCPPGTIPKFSEGCIVVGISNCAPEFIEADGHCYPSPDKCGVDSFPVPSEGCVPIDGEGCGSGTWGNIADAPGTIWVDPSYAGGDGDGSQLKPVTSIADALALGGRVALAQGNYAEALAVVSPVEIVGRCPSLVQLSGVGPTPLGIPAIVFANSVQGLVLRNLRIGGAGDGVLAVDSDVELYGVHVRAATGTGLLPVGLTSILADRTLIERTAATANGMFGRGVDAAEGTEVVLRQSAVIENRELAVFAQGAMASVTVIDSVLARTLPQASDSGDGRGVEARLGAVVTLESSALLENRDAALNAMDSGTSLTVRDSLIGRTLARESDLAGGLGAIVRAGALVTIESSAFVENREVALLAIGAGTHVDVNETLLARTLPHATELSFGRGAVAQEGAILAIAGSAIVDNREVALYAVDPGTSVTVSASLIARTLPRESSLGMGHGVEVQRAANVTLESSALVENRDVALVVARDDARAVMTESVIAGTLPRQTDSAYGMGAGCSGNGRIEVVSSAIRDSATAALIFGIECTGRVSGTLLERVADGRFNLIACPEGVPSPCPDMEVIVATYDGVGDGLVVAFGSTVDVERTRVAEVMRAALIYHQSAGILRSVHANGDAFGLVLQGQPRPDWQDASNLFEGGQQAVVSDGNLPVPEAPPLP